MNTHFHSFAVIALIIVSACVPNRQHDLVMRGNHALDTGDHETVYAVAKEMAEAGDATGQHNLGMSLSAGVGVAKNQTEANQWFCRAANQGHPKTFFVIARRYMNGDGVLKSHFLATKWAGLGARLGDVEAQYMYGLNHYFYYGVKKNVPEAYKWVTLAKRRSPNADDGWAEYVEAVKKDLSEQQRRKIEASLEGWKPDAFYPDIAKEVQSSLLCEKFLKNNDE